MTKIRIEKGIVIFHRDGSITNFPNGNNDEYKAWLHSDESKDVVLYMGIDGVKTQITNGSNFELLMGFIKSEKLEDKFNDILDEIDGALNDGKLSSEDEIEGHILKSWSRVHNDITEELI